MADLDLSERALAELKREKRLPPIHQSPARWDGWISTTAAASVIVVVGAMLLTLTAELRAGWIPGHELPMDKATAIHKLLFRS